ncbi:hypothetical protein PCANC_15336 [Puccinia coronata f. sp. avenae]|uniref:Uncharacterized protein n=1 Tax=Puccinia coronata f. sp. avenae TaxID=200324 RepID=A0A2N5SXC1_9BASI|nr:hypothetical protein PCANC_15336 [Puccinia coronata f. sp. avenae]
MTGSSSTVSKDKGGSTAANSSKGKMGSPMKAGKVRSSNWTSRVKVNVFSSWWKIR